MYYHSLSHIQPHNQIFILHSVDIPMEFSQENKSRIILPKRILYTKEYFGRTKRIPANFWSGSLHFFITDKNYSSLNSRSEIFIRYSLVTDSSFDRPPPNKRHECTICSNLHYIHIVRFWLTFRTRMTFCPVWPCMTQPPLRHYCT